MQTLWSNFAKYLNPNGNDDNDDIIWPQYTNSDDMSNYLDFETVEGHNECNQKSTFDDDTTDICSFWDKVGYSGIYSNPNDIISTPIVNTTIGFIEGYTVTYTYGDVNAFVSIPYAKPPVDELRFASPEPITESIGDEANPFQATELDARACMQPSNPLSPGEISMSEDCLYLSIVAPSDAEYLTTNYTVMVWIHGGGYVVGSSLDIDPSNFVSYIGDIIIVMINYRLGAFGFLYDNLYDTGLYILL